tara:strand:- start:989 stop:1750 length:762 start_codon:yes stop_codon:yes gene_type:complete
MRIILITQDEPFFLQESIKRLLKHLPKNTDIVGCVVSDVSPFGKKESFLIKAIKTLQIFGIYFFIRYAIKYIFNKLFNKSVKQFLSSEGINLIELNESINSEKSLNKLTALEPDLLISIAGNEIFKKDLINLAPKGCLNLHTGLLPKYRGLMPTFWAMKNKEEYIGVSVFFVDEGIDSGPIIEQEKLNIKGMSQNEVILLTKKIGMDLIIKAIKKIKEEKFELKENNDDDMSYYGFPTRDDVICFTKSGNKFF